MRLLAIAVAFAVLSLFARTASADTTNLDLTWEAPPGCASRAEIAERVGRLLGDGTRARQNVRAHAIVSEASGRFRADLELASGPEAGAHRIVEGESCPAVADAVVTIVALAIDPEAAVSAPSPPATTPPPPPPRPARPLELSIGVAGRLDVGSLPSAAFGGQAIIGASYYSIGVELDGSLLASARATLDTNANQGADISMREIGGRISHTARFGPLEVGVAINGVAFFNQYQASNQLITTSSGEYSSFDLYGGHPTPMNEYHYHIEPNYLTTQKGRDALMGFMLDGFPIYGPVENNVTLTSADLDAYHGHTSATADYPDGIYHYHITADLPYINGDGYYGVQGTWSH